MEQNQFVNAPSMSNSNTHGRVFNALMTGAKYNFQLEALGKRYRAGVQRLRDMGYDITVRGGLYTLNNTTPVNNG